MVKPLEGRPHPSGSGGEARRCLKQSYAVASVPLSFDEKASGFFFFNLVLTGVQSKPCFARAASPFGGLICIPVAS